MTIHQLSFGILLRRWRERRRMTQADLAFAANSSTRHVSFMETGRSQPSREMVLRLAEHLQVPLRQRNALLHAAGLAPEFAEGSLAELAAARTVMEQILQAHLPYPAFAFDKNCNLVLSNGALPQLYEGCSPELLRKPVNAVRLGLHPQGMGPRVENFVEWRAHMVAWLRQQLDARADAGLQALLTEVMSYPVPAGGGLALVEPDGPQRYAMPLRISTRFGTVSFLNTTTVFGAPLDVTLSELALEMLFPADQQTRTIVQRMVAEEPAQLATA